MSDLNKKPSYAHVPLPNPNTTQKEAPPTSGTQGSFQPSPGAQMPYPPPSGAQAPYSPPYSPPGAQPYYPPSSGAQAPYPPPAGTQAPYPPSPGAQAPYPPPYPPPGVQPYYPPPSAQIPYAQPGAPGQMVNFFPNMTPLMQLEGEIKRQTSRINGALGAAIFMGIVNMGLGIFLSLLPTLFAGTLFASGSGVLNSGWIFIIIALLPFGLSLGLMRKSRVCSILFVVFLGIDTLLGLINLFSGDASLSTSPFSFMRFFLIWLASAGIGGCFGWHRLAERYKNHPDPEIAARFARKPLKIRPAPAIILGVMAVGIICAILGLVRDFGSMQELGSFGTKVDIDSWDTYKTPDGRISFSTPSDVDVDKNWDGTVYYYAYNDTCTVEVIYTRNLLNENISPQEKRQELNENLLALTDDEDLMPFGQPSFEALGDGTIFAELYAEDPAGYTCALRVYARANDVYTFCFSMPGTPDDPNVLKQSAKFMRSIVFH